MMRVSILYERDNGSRGVMVVDTYSIDDAIDKFYDAHPHDIMVDIFVDRPSVEE
jgi:hypothetical protein